MTPRQRVYVTLLLTGWLTAAAFMPMTISPVRFLAVMGTVALVAWAAAWAYDVFLDLRATRRRCGATPRPHIAANERFAASPHPSGGTPPPPATGEERTQ